MPHRDPDTGEFVKTVEHEAKYPTRVNVKTGKIAAGGTISNDSESVPIDSRDNEVFRIYETDIALARYGASNTIGNARFAAGSEDDVEVANDSFNSWYDVEREDFLCSIEHQVMAVEDQTNGLGIAFDWSNQTALSDGPGYVDWPLGDINFCADNPASNSLHWWVDCIFKGEIIEVDDEHNVDLLRSSLGLL